VNQPVEEVPVKLEISPIAEILKILHTTVDTLFGWILIMYLIVSCVYFVCWGSIVGYDAIVHVLLPMSALEFVVLCSGAFGLKVLLECWA
jgi:hypothetical protein